MWYVGDIPIVDENHALVFSGFLFTTLAFVVISARLFTRAVLVRNVGVDDILMCIAFVGSLSFLISTLYQIKFGLGDAVILAELQDFLKALWSTVISYSFTQLTVKFSIIFQYKRIFRTPKASKIFNWLLIWMCIYASFALSSSIVTCVPLQKYWDDSIPGGCINRSNLHYGLAGFNIMNDLCLLLIPIPFLKDLQVTKRAKYILLGVFTCGAFTCIVAIIRLYSLWVNNSAPIDQQPIEGVAIALWSCLEINIAAICASVPALKALFVKVIPKLSSLQESFKRSAHNTNGTVPLGSVEHVCTRKSVSDLESGEMAIKVQSSIEMRALPMSDDDSEKDLVTTSWMADCYSGSPVQSKNENSRHSHQARASK